jgi:hypothetical protein
VLKRKGELGLFWKFFCDGSHFGRARRVAGKKAFSAKELRVIGLARIARFKHNSWRRLKRAI